MEWGNDKYFSSLMTKARIQTRIRIRIRGLPLFEECLVYQLPVSDQLIPQPAQTFPGKNPAWDRENLVVKKAVKSESNSLIQSQQ